MGEENGAEDGTRTRDPHLGKVMLYQLSHVRVEPTRYQRGARTDIPGLPGNSQVHLTRR